jgi:hypothetical protein
VERQGFSLLIGPGEVDLGDDATRTSFFSQVGERDQYTSVISSDITSDGSGSRKVDRQLDADSPTISQLTVGTHGCICSRAACWSVGLRGNAARLDGGHSGPVVLVPPELAPRWRDLPALAWLVTGRLAGPARRIPVLGVVARLGGWPATMMSLAGARAVGACAAYRLAAVLTVQRRHPRRWRWRARLAVPGWVSGWRGDAGDRAAGRADRRYRRRACRVRRGHDRVRPARPPGVGCRRALPSPGDIAGQTAAPGACGIAGGGGPPA